VLWLDPLTPAPDSLLLRAADKQPLTVHNMMSDEDDDGGAAGACLTRVCLVTL